MAQRFVLACAFTVKMITLKKKKKKAEEEPAQREKTAPIRKGIARTEHHLGDVRFAGRCFISSPYTIFSFKLDTSPFMAQAQCNNRDYVRWECYPIPTHVSSSRSDPFINRLIKTLGAFMRLMDGNTSQFTRVNSWFPSAQSLRQMELFGKSRQL